MSEQIETCRSNGHQWQTLLGGKRCLRCGEQIATRGDWGQNGYYGYASAEAWSELEASQISQGIPKPTPQ